MLAFERGQRWASPFISRDLISAVRSKLDPTVHIAGRVRSPLRQLRGEDKPTRAVTDDTWRNVTASCGPATRWACLGPVVCWRAMRGWWGPSSPDVTLGNFWMSSQLRSRDTEIIWKFTEWTPEVAKCNFEIAVEFFNCLIILGLFFSYQPLKSLIFDNNSQNYQVNSYLVKNANF